MNRTILVSGGAGYLGRSTISVLQKAGYTPVCVDNYSTSHPFQASGVVCHELELTDRDAVAALWKTLPALEGVLHFAAFALVPESVEKPGDYFRNNLLATIHLAEQAARAKIPFVHSSSCAVYGIPKKVPIDETCELSPISPYGESKRCSEQILKQFSDAQGLRVLNLRYFNPAGSLDPTVHGEAHEPETHLVPNAMRAAKAGKTMYVYGDQHPTPDGTCIRDFLHVEDLALGHTRALEFLADQKAGFSDAVNLGSGKGRSVREVLAAVEKVTGKKLHLEVRPARPGDPPALVASIAKAEKVLGWKPQHGLDALLQSHWAWETSSQR